MVSEEKPYIEKEVSHIVRLYNHKYGDDRVGVCGHVYYRHFDCFEELEDAAIGCKYCSCYTFIEPTNGSSAN